MNTVNYFKSSLFYLGRVLDASCPILVTVFGVIASYPTEADFEERRPIVHHFYSMVHDNLAVIFLMLLVAYLLGKLLLRLGDPWILNKLQFILDQYQGKAFNKNGDEAIPKDHNRVTLFKYKKRVVFTKHWSGTRAWFPWSLGDRPFMSNYLVPILRSGHLAKKTKVAFFAPDIGDDAEGIAGLAWASESVAQAHNLPHITKDCPKRDIKVYAEQTRCSEAMIEYYRSSGKKMPRSIVAIPVERNNENWGVVVLDSRYPEGISANAAENYKLTITLIGHLLERL